MGCSVNESVRTVLYRSLLEKPSTLLVVTPSLTSRKCLNKVRQAATRMVSRSDVPKVVQLVDMVLSGWKVKAREARSVQGKMYQLVGESPSKEFKVIDSDSSLGKLHTRLKAARELASTCS